MAFEEIPLRIKSGEISHFQAIPGDGRYRCEVADESPQDYQEMWELKDLLREGEVSSDTPITIDFEERRVS